MTKQNIISELDNMIWEYEENKHFDSPNVEKTIEVLKIVKEVMEKTKCKLSKC